jgi:nicotinic acid mononucleotide adenylyltransferase
MVVLDSWYEWQQLLQLATFVIATRGEADVDDVLAFMRGYPDVFPEVDTTRRRLNSGFGGELPGSEPEYMHIRWGGSSQAHWAAFLTMPRLDVSGTQLRALWRANRQSLGLVPECVEDVLRDHEAEVGSVWGARGSESL